MLLSPYPLLLLKAQLCWRLTHRWSVLRKHQRLVLAGVLLGSAGALWLNWRLPEVWRSTAVLHLRPFGELEREANRQLQTPDF